MSKSHGKRAGTSNLYRTISQERLTAREPSISAANRKGELKRERREERRGEGAKR